MPFRTRIRIRIKPLPWRIIVTLEDLGYNREFSEAFAALDIEDAVPGRVVWQSAYSYRVWSESGEVAAEPAGRVKSSGLPVVGDWVAVQALRSAAEGNIIAVLPRRSAFSRNSAGKSVSEQVVAANIDEALIVTDMEQDLNLRRIERYITLVYNSGAGPVVVLNKADRAADPGAFVAQVESVSPGVPVYAVSAHKNEGFGQIREHTGPGRTIAFLGSSGVGKSTIINRLLGENILAVGDVRETDGKGRHKTTHRELVVLPQGGAVIDTPGMREIQVWGGEGGLAEAFPEIEEIAAACRFRDCRHGPELGCAVAEAVRSGQLDDARFNSYVKLRAEFENLGHRRGLKARMEEKRAGKRFARMVKEVNRYNPKRKNRPS